jgi:hypothetical protein
MSRPSLASSSSYQTARQQNVQIRATDGVITVLLELPQLRSWYTVLFRTSENSPQPDIIIQQFWNMLEDILLNVKEPLAIRVRSCALSSRGCLILFTMFEGLFQYSLLRSTYDQQISPHYLHDAANS